MFTAGCFKYPVKPVLQLDGKTAAMQADGKVEVAGAETFDRTIHPVSFFCSANEYNIEFAALAKDVIRTRLEARLGAGMLARYRHVVVTVDNAMIRTMNVAKGALDPRFVVEARIALTAKLEPNAGDVRVVSARNQEVHTGDISSDSMTCELGKFQLEKSLPILLQHSVDALAAKIV